MAVEIGAKGYAEKKVEEWNTAKAMGSGHLEVFATPAMVALMEQAAVNALELEEGQSSVGVLIEIKHHAATPLGIRVRAEAELVEIDRRRLVFIVKAFDEVEEIGSGRHERFIIDANSFMTKVRIKQK